MYDIMLHSHTSLRELYKTTDILISKLDIMCDYIEICLDGIMNVIAAARLIVVLTMVVVVLYEWQQWVLLKMVEGM
jgi:hypothetical protein